MIQAMVDFEKGEAEIDLEEGGS